MIIPKIRPVGYDDDWALLNDWSFYHKDIGIHTIKAGFIYDLASIPKFLRSYIQKTDRRTWGPALVHDYRYKSNIGSRSKADKEFRVALIKNNFPVRKAWTAWLVVRVVGWYHWRKKTGSL